MFKLLLYLFKFIFEAPDLSFFLKKKFKCGKVKTKKALTHFPGDPAVGRDSW